MIYSCGSQILCPDISKPTEFGISLEVAAKRALGTASNSKVLGIFLEKGSKRSEMDAFLI